LARKVNEQTTNSTTIMKTIAPQFDLPAMDEAFNLAGETFTEIHPAPQPMEDTKTVLLFALPPITSRCPSQTPWGPVQQREQIAPGIWSVSTAGHGGIWIAPELRPLAPDWLLAGTGYSGEGWFEEDCDWALACAAFPSMFPARDCYFALKTLESPSDYLAERRARYFQTELSKTLRQRAALHDEKEASATA
jgi:hypothetical protein